MPIVFSRAGFEWPDGNSVFQELSFSLTDKVYALTGVNGAGKTTLARLISGELEPTSGKVTRVRAEFFHQSESPPAISVAEYLNSSQRDPLAEVLLQKIPRVRSCNDLSGGEWTRVRLAKLALSEPSFAILDEPTNHLDREGRAAVREFIQKFKGGILLISHDRELLALAEEILELTPHGLSIFTGSWADFQEARSHERERLKQNLENAKRKRDIKEKERHQKIAEQEKRQEKGRQAGIKANLPKIIRGGLKRQAQQTMGRVDKNTKESLDQAVSESWQAYQSLKFDPVMYARLPKVNAVHGRVVMEAENFNFKFNGSSQPLFAQALSFSFRAPARIAMTGANGSGKSTLLKLLMKEKLNGTQSGALRIGPQKVEFLSQDHSSLDPQLSILENVRTTAGISESDARGLLAMFLFTKDMVHQKVSTLSGGERLRAALAKILLANPPPEMLILDEPTNNLDLPNIEFLEDLLSQYQGSLIVVSHDEQFLQNLGIIQELNL